MHRLLLLKWFLCAALLSGMALCPRLWTPYRDFPEIPVLDVLPTLKPGMTFFLTGGLVISVLCIAVLPRRNLGYFFFPLFALALVEFDINRLQPWFYQYILMFLALALVKEKATWSICAFIIAALYMWSGIQKMNAGFIDTVFPYLTEPLGKGLSESLRPLAYAAPFLELLTGVFLFLPRTRHVGLGLVVAMHLLLLLALGPLGLNANSVVWPWNFWMPFIAFALFFRNPDPILPDAWSHPTGKAILLLTGLFPILNFLGKWDDYLSASLYSGKSKSGWIVFTEEGLRKFQSLHPKSPIVQVPGALPMLDIYGWSLADINVPSYPQERVFRAIEKSLEKEGIPPREMKLLVKE